MTARDVISQALALSEAASDRWEAGAGWAFEFDPTDPPTDRLRNVFKAERSEEDEARVQHNIKFAVAARTLLPAFAKALGDVLDVADGHDQRADQAGRLDFDPTQSGMATAHRQAARGIRAAITAALSEVTP